jgi:hypothetical protein
VAGERGKGRPGVRRAVPSLLFAVALAAAGCAGKDRPPPAADSVHAPPGAGTGGSAFDGDGTKPPGCGTTDQGAYCDCVDVPLFADPPNLYFVLDRSGSMADGNKWDQVRITVGRLLRGLGPRASFGAAIFPGGTSSNGSACGAGIEVMSVRPGDPPSSQVDGPTTQKLLEVTRVKPHGGTPTAATLQAVLPRVAALPGKTFVILATDGGPNCNDRASCGPERCMLNIENLPGCPSAGPSCCEPPEGFRENCLDADPTLAAVANLRNAGVPVFVIGIPGSAPYGAHLDQLAEVGGTALPASPKYFRVDGADDEQLLAALKKVAAKIVATCELELTEPPHDPGLVNVYFDDVALPPDPENGWTLDGSTVTLTGAACARVLAGDVLDVRIIAGCPTVGPR